jgi:hypothetical protein
MVSKRVEKGRRLSALRTGHPRNGHKAFSAVAIERLGMAGPSETLGSPWPLLAIHPYVLHPTATKQILNIEIGFSLIIYMTPVILIPTS